MKTTFSVWCLYSYLVHGHDHAQTDGKTNIERGIRQFFSSLKKGKCHLEVHDKYASRRVLIQLKADPASQLTPADHVDTISCSGVDDLFNFILYFFQ